MPESYEISYHPVGYEEPGDVHSGTYQNRLWVEAAGRTGWPGAIDELYLCATDNRRHFIVTKGPTCVVRILRAPLERDFPSGVWEDAMVIVMQEMGRQYPLFEYDMAFGGSCLMDAMRAFPLATNYGDVPIEQVVLTPRAI